MVMFNTDLYRRLAPAAGRPCSGKSRALTPTVHRWVALHMSASSRWKPSLVWKHPTPLVSWWFSNTPQTLRQLADFPDSCDDPRDDSSLALHLINTRLTMILLRYNSHNHLINTRLTMIVWSWWYCTSHKHETHNDSVIMVILYIS